MHLDRGADDPLHDLVDGWIVRPNYRRVAEALRSQTFRRGAPDNFWPAHLGSLHFKSPKPISTSIPACLESFARQGRSKVEQSPKKRKRVHLGCPEQELLKWWLVTISQEITLYEEGCNCDINSLCGF